MCMTLLPLGVSAQEHKDTANTQWYDESGNRVREEKLIAQLENRASVIMRAPACCMNPAIEIYYREEHLYERPLPSPCVYYKYRTTYCANCELVISDVYIGQYTHTHQ